MDEPTPQPPASGPRRSLAGWLWRFGLVGAALAPLVAMGAARHRGLTEDLLCLSPVLGLAVGGACGLAGWGLTKAVGG